MRVNADRFTQITQPSKPGQAAGVYYLVEATAYHLNVISGRFFSNYTTYYRSQAFLNHNTALGPLKGLELSQPAGGYTGLGLPLAGLDSSQDGYYIFNPYANDRGNRTDWSRTDNYMESAQVTSVTVLSGTEPIGGTPGPCETKFYKNNVLVLTLAGCPEVTNGKGCSDCCGELLTLARSITA